MAPKKCEHPICSCQVSEGRYCSAECAAMEETPDVDCTCPHASCAGHTEAGAASA